MTNVLATLEVRDREGEVLATFQAERGPVGQGIVWLVHKDGDLRLSRFAGAVVLVSDHAIIDMAVAAAESHCQAYCPAAQVIRHERD